MPRYFFDSQDGIDEVFIDNVGIECADLDEVRIEAARGLADLAKDILPGIVRRELSIHVRDDQNQAVFRTDMVIDISVPQQEDDKSPR